MLLVMPWNKYLMKNKYVWKNYSWLIFFTREFFLPDVFPQLAIKKFLKMPNNILICDNNSGRLDIYLPKTPGLVASMTLHLGGIEMK